MYNLSEDNKWPQRLLFWSFSFSCSISWSLAFKLKCSSSSLSFSSSKSTGANANVVGTAQLLSLNKSTLWDFFLSGLYRKITSFWLLVTFKSWCISSLVMACKMEAFCFYLTLLQKYDMNVTLDDFPLLGSVMYHQGLCVYLPHKNVSSIFMLNFLWPQNHLCHLIRLHHLLISAFDF